MYRILIFGTGLFLENRKKEIFQSNLIDIIGFVDNSYEKQHTSLYGYYIFSPEEAVNLKFDYILLMSKDEINIKNQLLALGVKEKYIITYNDYDILKLCSEMRVYSSFNEKREGNSNNIILLLSHELTNTGAPIVLVYMAMLLKKNGYYPIIISRTNGMLQEKILHEEILLIVCKELSRDNFILSMLLQRTSLVICNTVELGFLVSDYAGVSKKVIWWIHEGTVNYGRKTIAYCKSDLPVNVKVYAVSELSKKIFVQYAGNKKTEGILPYGIPDRGCKEKSIEKRIKFLLAGTLSKRKGQDIMIEAIQNLSDEERECAEFIFAGSVADVDIYEKIRNCNLNSVIYLGELSVDRMQELYESIDVVVCPSREDPLPVVLTEAMMNKRLCIMSDNTGTASLIKAGQDGLICRTDDVESLAEQISWVIHNTDKLPAIMQAGRRVYENFFTMEAFEKRIMSMVDR